MWELMKRIAINGLGRIARGYLSACCFIDENESILRPKKGLRVSGMDK